MLKEIFKKVRESLPQVFVGITGPKMRRYDLLDEDKEDKHDDESGAIFHQEI